MPLIETSILPGGVVFLKLSGDLTNEHRAEIEQGIAESRKTIDDQKQQMGDKVPCLLDLSAFTGKYDQEIVILFADFAAKNAAAISKTAAYGGNLNADLVTETVGAIAGRDNIEVFPTKEEAMAALGMTA